MVATRTVHLHKIDRGFFQNSNRLEKEIKMQLHYLNPIFVKAIKSELFWEVFISFKTMEEAKTLVTFEKITLEYGDD